MREASLANGASSGGRSSLIPPALTAPRISPLLQVRDDRLARLDADGGLRLVGAGAQVRREHGVLQPEQRVVLRPAARSDRRRCAAPAIFFSFSASARANSSTTSPRASLTTSRFGLHLLNSRSRLSRCLVPLAAGDVEGDHVELARGTRRSRGPSSPCRPERCRRGEVGVEAEDVHLHRERAAGDGAPDAAHARRRRASCRRAACPGRRCASSTRARRT